MGERADRVNDAKREEARAEVGVGLLRATRARWLADGRLALRQDR